MKHEGPYYPCAIGFAGARGSPHPDQDTQEVAVDTASIILTSPSNWEIYQKTFKAPFPASGNPLSIPRSEYGAPAKYQALNS